MKKRTIWCLVILVILIWGCAASGQKFINIYYLGQHEKPQNQIIGLGQFLDLRANIQSGQKGYIGYRDLMDNRQETYSVYGLNLLKSLNHVTKKYLEHKGLNVLIIDRWDPSLEGVQKSNVQAEHILTADINRFECRAKNNGITTKMVLDVDMIFYLGLMDRHSLKKIPVSLTLERTELGFTPKKLEKFVSQAMTEDT